MSKLFYSYTLIKSKKNTILRSFARDLVPPNEFATIGSLLLFIFTIFRSIFQTDPCARPAPPPGDSIGPVGPRRGIAYFNQYLSVQLLNTVQTQSGQRRSDVPSSSSRPPSGRHKNRLGLARRCRRQQCRYTAPVTDVYSVPRFPARRMQYGVGTNAVSEHGADVQRQEKKRQGPRDGRRIREVTTVIGRYFIGNRSARRKCRTR